MDIVLAEIMLFSGYTAWCSCGIVGHVIAYLISLLLNEVLFSLGASLSLLPLKTLAIIESFCFYCISFFVLFWYSLRVISIRKFPKIKFCNATVKPIL